MMVIGVKYCGHCQPHRYMPPLVALLGTRLPQMGFVPWDEAPAAAPLLICHACPAACAHVEGLLPAATLGHNSFNHTSYARDEDLLAAAARFFTELTERSG